MIKGITKTKEININTKHFWDDKWYDHGGGERKDPDRLKPLAELASGEVLDVGCGLGHLCYYLHQKGCSPVWGVDISSEAITHSRRNYSFLNFKVGEAENLPFADNQFDTVTLAEILEHLTDFKEGLNEAIRVCKKGGQIVFAVPDNSVYTEHVWTFTEEGVKNLLKHYKGKYQKVAINWLMGWFEV